MVARVHIAQVVCARTCKSRHGVQFQRENGYIVNLLIIDHAFVCRVPSPFRGMSQRRFARFGGQEFGHFRKFQRQAAFINHVRHSVLVVNRERFAPIALAREDGVAQAEVYFYASQIMFFHIFLGGGDGFLNSQSVQVEVAIRLCTCFRRVAYDTLFGIETFFAYIAAFHQRNDRQVEVLGKSVVAAVVCRYGHDGACSVSC